MYTIRSLGLLLLTPWIAAADGCLERPCTPSIEPGVMVRIVDAATGEGITSATATLTEGTYSEVLRPPFNSEGSYVGADERPGTYRLSVTAGGYEPETIDGIVVDMSPTGCHVVTVYRTVELQPSE